MRKLSSKKSRPTSTKAPRRKTEKAFHAWAWVMNTAIIGGITAAMGLTALALTDESGRAGTVGTFAADAPLSCGGRYEPAAPGVFHPTLPCGALVKVLNPATGAEVIAPVVSNAVAFGESTGRVADVSVATAKALGLDQSSPQPIVLRGLVGTLPGLKQMAPIVPSLTPEKPVTALPYSKADIHALALNMLGECQVCGTKGMVATSAVALNRLAVRFNGKSSLHDVVYDHGEFSWTLKGQRKPPKSGKAYAQSRALAVEILTDNLSGDLLAVRYAVTNRALYYYAPDVIPTPKWGSRTGKLVPVAMENRKEVALFHRFFEYKPKKQDAIATLLAQN
jgi:rare lipoprotein A